MYSSKTEADTINTEMEVEKEVDTEIVDTNTQIHKCMFCRRKSCYNIYDHVLDHGSIIYPHKDVIGVFSEKIVKHLHTGLFICYECLILFRLIRSITDVMYDTFMSLVRGEFDDGEPVLAAFQMFKRDIPQIKYLDEDNEEYTEMNNPRSSDHLMEVMYAVDYNESEQGYTNCSGTDRDDREIEQLFKKRKRRKKKHPLWTHRKGAIKSLSRSKMYSSYSEYSSNRSFSRPSTGMSQATCSTTYTRRSNGSRKSTRSKKPNSPHQNKPKYDKNSILQNKLTRAVSRARAAELSNYHPCHVNYCLRIYKSFDELTKHTMDDHCIDIVPDLESYAKKLDDYNLIRKPKLKFKPDDEALLRYKEKYKYPCLLDTCLKRCNDQDELQAHKISGHHLTAMYSCRECFEKRFTTEEELVLHNDSVHNKVPCYCFWCMTMCVNPKELQNHLQEHTYSHFPCDKCDLAFIDHKSLQKHNKTAHVDENRRTKIKDSFAAYLNNNKREKKKLVKKENKFNIEQRITVIDDMEDIPEQPKPFIRVMVQDNRVVDCEHSQEGIPESEIALLAEFLKPGKDHVAYKDGKVTNVSEKYVIMDVAPDDSSVYNEMPNLQRQTNDNDVDLVEMSETSAPNLKPMVTSTVTTMQIPEKQENNAPRIIIENSYVSFSNATKTQNHLKPKILQSIQIPCQTTNTLHVINKEISILEPNAIEEISTEAMETTIGLVGIEISTNEIMPTNQGAQQNEEDLGRKEIITMPIVGEMETYDKKSLRAYIVENIISSMLDNAVKNASIAQRTESVETFQESVATTFGEEVEIVPRSANCLEEVHQISREYVKTAETCNAENDMVESQISADENMQIQIYETQTLDNKAFGTNTLEFAQMPTIKECNIVLRDLQTNVNTEIPIEDVECIVDGNDDNFISKEMERQGVKTPMIQEMEETCIIGEDIMDAIRKSIAGQEMEDIEITFEENTMATDVSDGIETSSLQNIADASVGDLHNIENISSVLHSLLDSGHLLSENEQVSDENINVKNVEVVIVEESAAKNSNKKSISYENRQEPSTSKNVVVLEKENKETEIPKNKEQNNTYDDLNVDKVKITECEDNPADLIVAENDEDENVSINRKGRQRNLLEEISQGEEDRLSLEQLKKKCIVKLDINKFDIDKVSKRKLRTGTNLVESKPQIELKKTNNIIESVDGKNSTKRITRPKKKMFYDESQFDEFLRMAHKGELVNLEENDPTLKKRKVRRISENQIIVDDYLEMVGDPNEDKTIDIHNETVPEVIKKKVNRKRGKIIPPIEESISATSITKGEMKEMFDSADSIKSEVTKIKRKTLENVTSNVTREDTVSEIIGIVVDPNENNTIQNELASETNIKKRPNRRKTVLFDSSETIARKDLNEEMHCHLIPDSKGIEKCETTKNKIKVKEKLETINTHKNLDETVSEINSKKKANRRQNMIIEPSIILDKNVGSTDDKSDTNDSEKNKILPSKKLIKPESTKNRKVVEKDIHDDIIPKKANRQRNVIVEPVEICLSFSGDHNGTATNYDSNNEDIVPRIQVKTAATKSFKISKDNEKSITEEDNIQKDTIHVTNFKKRAIRRVNKILQAAEVTKNEYTTSSDERSTSKKIVPKYDETLKISQPEEKVNREITNNKNTDIPSLTTNREDINIEKHNIIDFRRKSRLEFEETEIRLLQKYAKPIGEENSLNKYSRKRRSIMDSMPNRRKTIQIEKNDMLRKKFDGEIDSDNFTSLQANTKNQRFNLPSSVVPDYHTSTNAVYKAPEESVNRKKKTRAIPKKYEAPKKVQSSEADINIDNELVLLNASKDTKKNSDELRIPSVTRKQKRKLAAMTAYIEEPCEEKLSKKRLGVSNIVTKVSNVISGKNIPKNKTPVHLFEEALNIKPIKSNKNNPRKGNNSKPCTSTNRFDGR